MSHPIDDCRQYFFGNKKVAVQVPNARVSRRQAVWGGGVSSSFGEGSGERDVPPP